MKTLVLIGLGLLASSLACAQTSQKIESVVESIAQTPEKVVITAGDADADTGLSLSMSFEIGLKLSKKSFKPISGKAKPDDFSFQEVLP